jgi:hypothetical protein
MIIKLNLVLKKFQNPKEKFSTQVTNNFYTIFNPDTIQTDVLEKRSTSLNVKNSDKRNEIKGNSNNKVGAVEDFRLQLKEKNEFIKLLINERNTLNDKVRCLFI